MDLDIAVSNGLVSLVALATMAGGVLADVIIPGTARQHFGNPNWPPHAKFHNGQTIILGVLLGALALWLTWLAGDLTVHFHLAVIVTALVWLSMVGAGLLPATRWVDPEFDERRRQVPPQLRLALTLLALLLVAEIVRLW
ncbi:DUF6640 family protein [Actinophytocola sp.]|uniref:DUF6640 family protein n=1 Tax=Actinophytocola sp. TaxID=1872138 RepID=UPI002D7E7FCB|nr:DUF6640 family protein [Actinophytocola sp.]HET9138773.1 DUF6640 family protein [Actinophytocola sp.]